MNLPTSLLAMVDASLGGKTGCDLPQGKNLVGAFHPPSLVLADPQTLETLPEVELRNGLAEALKHGVLGDKTLFEHLTRGDKTLFERLTRGDEALLERLREGMPEAGEALEQVVRQAMAVKLRVIEKDPYERGERATLNLGHTLGHALEQASDYRMRHGEAVAIGMLAAARLAEKMGVAEQGTLAEMVEAALRRLGLPTEMPPGLERGRVLRAMMLDKKRRSGKLRVTLPVRIGACRWGVEIDDPSELMDMVG